MFRFTRSDGDRSASSRGWAVAIPYLAFGVVALGILNFVWFMVETLPLNLLPSNERVVDGHFYMWSKIQGGLVDVGKQAFEWLPVHERILFLTWPLVMVALGTLVFRHFGGQISGSASAEAGAARVVAVRESGLPIASARAGARIGVVFFSRPLVRIDVHPGGILVKPVFLPERAILAAEIAAVAPQGGLSPETTGEHGPVLAIGASEVSTRWRPRGPSLIVDHVAVGMATPLEIIGSGWDVVLAVRRIANATVETPQDVAAQVVSVGTNELPSSIQAGGILLGMFVSVALIWSGVTFAIPRFGLAGIAWTAGIIVILAINIRRYVRQRSR